MEYVGDEDIRVVVIEIDGIGKTTHQNPPYIVESNWKMFRVAGNSGKRFFQTTKKLIPKTDILSYHQ